MFLHRFLLIRDEGLIIKRVLIFKKKSDKILKINKFIVQYMRGLKPR